MALQQVSLEIVINLITMYGNCGRCGPVFKESGVEGEITHEALAEYPEDMKEECIQLSCWISELARLYRHRINIRLIDAKSPQGIFKALRHRFRTYPTFIIDKKVVLSGWDRAALEAIIDNRLKEISCS